MLPMFILFKNVVLHQIYHTCYLTTALVLVAITWSQGILSKLWNLYGLLSGIKADGLPWCILSALFLAQ